MQHIYPLGSRVVVTEDDDSEYTGEVMRITYTLKHPWGFYAIYGDDGIYYDGVDPKCLRPSPTANPNNLYKVK